MSFLSLNFLVKIKEDIVPFDSLMVIKLKSLHLVNYVTFLSYFSGDLVLDNKFTVTISALYSVCKN